MSVHLRERPAVQRALRALRAGYPQRLMPPALRAAAAVLGCMGARAPVLGGMHPLGLCFAMSVPAPYALYTAAGAAVGALWSLPLDVAAPYLAAAAAVGLLRGLAFAGRQRTAAMMPAAAGGIVYCLIASGLAVAGLRGLPGVCAAAAEALLMLGASYLLAGFFLSARRGGAAAHASWDAEDRAALCFAWLALLCCLVPYTLFGLSAARAAAALAVLIAAGGGRQDAAAVLAVVSMVALCAAEPAGLYAGLGIAAGGLVGGLFAGHSRPVTAAAFCGAGLIGLFCAPSVGAGVRMGVELCLAGGVYCVLPARVLHVRVPDGAAPARPASPAGARTAAASLSGRLEAVSGALCTVGNTMRAVCDRLPPRHETMSDLCDAVAERCCSGCEKRLECWVDRAQETYDAFNQLAPLLAGGAGVSADELPPVLRGRCRTPLRLANAVSLAAAAQAARRAARVRGSAARAALCEQYSAMAAALTELAGQVYGADLPDPRKARRLEQLFIGLGLEPLEVSAALDAAGRMTAIVSLPRVQLSDAELRAITGEAAALLHRSFASAQCAHAGAATRLTFRETPRFAVDCAVCALPARGEVSADAVRTFTGDDGKFYAVLCDGMGTGKLAAVGGALAASLSRELLHAGVDSASAARLVNIALALKSDDENAVTLDILCVNLYTGDAVLYKAGAAASFVLRGAGAGGAGGSAAVYSSDTLPIGILGQVSGRSETMYLAPGDTAVLVSDGALAPGAPWLRAQLTAHAQESPKKLAGSVARAARERQREAPDDVTVIAVRLRKAGSGAG